ncbi:MAG: HAD family phosphatase [Lachnospiraceae bacterium]|nr:HAD family phosphatase [Lachnospiraceae bacterium]
MENIKKKGALFDMDGTLIDTEMLYRRFWREGVEARGGVFAPDFLRDIGGTSGQYTLDVIHRYYPFIDGDELRLSVRARVNAEIREHIPEKKGLHELLHFLKENGFKIALATASAHERIDAFVAGAHLENVFDAILSGQDLTKSKPDPEIFIKAAEALGLAPEECYVFEDGVNGVQAGGAAGCDTIMIPDIVPPTEAEEAICVGIYHDLLEVLEAIKTGEI